MNIADLEEGTVFPSLTSSSTPILRHGSLYWRCPRAADSEPVGRPGPIVVRRRCRTTALVRHEMHLCVAQNLLWDMECVL
jgi:hypothetical protein